MDTMGRNHISYDPFAKNLPIYHFDIGNDQLTETETEIFRNQNRYRYFQYLEIETENTVNFYGFQTELWHLK